MNCNNVEKYLSLLPKGYSLTKSGDNWEIWLGDKNVFGANLEEVLHRFLVVMWGNLGLELNQDIYIIGDADKIGGWGRIREIDYGDIGNPTFKVLEMKDYPHSDYSFDFVKCSRYQVPGELPDKSVRVQVKPKKISVEVVDDLKNKIKDLFPKTIWERVLAENSWLDGDYISLLKRVVKVWETCIWDSASKECNKVSEQEIVSLFGNDLWDEVKDGGTQSLLGMLKDAIWLTKIYAAREVKKKMPKGVCSEYDCCDCPKQENCDETEISKHRHIQLLQAELAEVKQELSACRTVNSFRGHTVSEWAGIATDYQIKIHNLERQITELKKK